MSADNRTLRPLSRPILKSDVLRCLALVCLALSPATSNADKDKGGVIADLLELSLEQLLDLQVTSVSRKAESLHEAAAAVFVITQEDIARSGATSIPEALRMVPGVQVAHVDANKWAISARGFNGRFANKLLVLMDGRTVYSPFFSGTFWDVQDTLLEDVERIEVIRGPGATLWGANAVNGVINIITKSAHATEGTLVTAGAGTEERGFGSARHGGALGDQASYRVYAKYFDRDGGYDLDNRTDGRDDWDQLRAGFRVDWDASARDTTTFQGDIYRGDSGGTVTVAGLTPPTAAFVDSDEEVSGGNLLLRWQRELSADSSVSLQAYYDRTSRDTVQFGEDRDTFDLDLQHRFVPAQGHELIWGLGYRYTRDDADNTFTISLHPDSRTDHLFSGFVQDQFSLVPERLKATLGVKLEHNDYSGFEVQPNARLLWTPTPRQSAWASVARAVRTPSRIDHDMRINAVLLPSSPTNPFGIPIVTSVSGDEDNDAEELIAYELGYRIQASERLRLDVAAFYNDYDRLITGRLGEPLELLPGPVLFQEIQFDNALSGETYGVELAADWRPRDRLRFQLAYSYLQMQLHSDAGTAGEEVAETWSPHHQGSLRTSLDLRSDLLLDLWVRYTDAVPALNFLGVGAGKDIGSYLTLDARLAWQATKQIEMALVGQNLLDDRQLEFAAETNDIPKTEIERSAYVQLTWRF